MRAVVALFVARAAAAQPATDSPPIPGGGDDPIRELTLDPGVVDTPRGLSIRGGAPIDTLSLIDGFRVPSLERIPGARSIVTHIGFEPVVLQTNGFGVEFGSGTSLVAVAPRRGTRDLAGDVELLTSGYASEAMGAVESGASQPYTSYLFGPVTADHARISVRSGLTELALPSIGALESMHPAFLDVHGLREIQYGKHWLVRGSAVGSFDLDHSWIARPTFSLAYATDRWSASIALSQLSVRTKIESGSELHLDIDETTWSVRPELKRTVPELAGLTNVVWQIGAQTDSTEYDLDIAWPFLPREGWPQATTPNPGDTSMRAKTSFWRHDLALWSAIAANLGPAIRAQIGVRIDGFGAFADRATYTSTQPRGSLDWRLRSDTQLRLSAGAYRRPPEQLDELLVLDTLHPERTTQLDITLAHRVHDGIDALVSTYYIDRSRLIMRERDGVLRNSGSGTSYGVEGTLIARREPWYARVATSLARSVRRDNPRAAERPFEFDQPFRLDALVSWKHDKWQLGARLRIASGLPYTPIVGTVYDSDNDYYEPLFSDRIYSERAPLQHRVDLRVDYAFVDDKRATLAAFIDLHNAYASRSELGYDYRFDYGERLPIYALPIFPFVGVRGTI